jgi:O-methyltransferase involved in polyketide biosynthesis
LTGSPRISPTAHYTGHVWARNGLSHPELDTTEGRAMYEFMRPSMLVSGALGAGTLERYLMARHTAIDRVLTRAIEQRGISQVLEIACGMSPRGWRFTERFPSLVYVEADLPAMAARKRSALERMGSLSERHPVVDIDVLSDDSVAAAVDDLDRGGGLAIITEGLLGYLPTDAVLGIWARFATTLSGFSTGRYISEVHLASAATPAIRAFRLALGAFVRGRVYLHFDEPDDVRAALGEAGFGDVELHGTNERVRIIEASTV